ncbi:calcium and integrin-binding family member 3-like isoform X1 [Vespula squamosa]|uniref:Calcium and integrin-binding family member 3-like isoform X1 n=1 Tax=Vespula squamosa TaxID=30214 RepID=A0ABD2AW76_VESSQ
MGNKVATFSEEQLEDYQDCTFFTRKEILRIFKRFREMGDPGMVPRTMTSQEASTLRLPLSYLARIPELKENPFRERISEVFTKSNRKQQSENTEGICFEDFLEMMSVFSEQAPRDLKVFYAFKIYDFDEDGVLGIGDLERTCRQLVQGGLTSEEVYTVCQKVLEESDIDGDGALSYLDFEHVVTRAPDFISTFHIRI